MLHTDVLVYNLTMLGLVESIVASALARCGKSVLHLDRYI